MALPDPRRVSAQYANASNLDSRITLHQRFSLNEQPWHRWAFEQIKLPANARILELGCGTAALWTENRDKIPETWRITLTDMSPSMPEDANANINLDLRNTLTRNFTFISTDAQAIRFGDSGFDAVIANHMKFGVGPPYLSGGETPRTEHPVVQWVCCRYNVSMFLYFYGCHACDSPSCGV